MKRIDATMRGFAVKDFNLTGTSVARLRAGCLYRSRIAYSVASI